jgi:hypothetical protein
MFTVLVCHLLYSIDTEPEMLLRYITKKTDDPAVESIVSFRVKEVKVVDTRILGFPRYTSGQHG